MILPQDLDRPIPTLHTIANWRDSKPKFDIRELKSAYIFDSGRYIKNILRCDIHNYDFKNNLFNACNCDNYHVVRPYFPNCFIWRDNYLALWKLGPKGNKLIWTYVEINECSYCSDLHMSFHTTTINNMIYCDCCYNMLYGGI